MSEGKYLVFDFETGGLDVNTCAVLQLGVEVLDSNLVCLDKFSTYFKPQEGKVIEDEALVINKIKRNSWAMDTKFKQASEGLELFFAFLSKYRKNSSTKFVLVGFNNKVYDTPLLRNFLAEESNERFNDWFYKSDLDVKCIVEFMLIDTYIKKHSLHYLCEKVGMDFDPDLAHNAVYDSDRTSELFRLCKAVLVGPEIFSISD